MHDLEAARQCYADMLPDRVRGRSLRREPHAAAPNCWLHGDGFCLSALPV
jgi:hypothetical protein